MYAGLRNNASAFHGACPGCCIANALLVYWSLRCHFGSISGKRNHWFPINLEEAARAALYWFNDFQWFSMISIDVHYCCIVFQWFSLILNDFHWFPMISLISLIFIDFALIFNDVIMTLQCYSMIFIDFHWSMIFITFALICNDLHWFHWFSLVSMIFITFALIWHWFCIDFQWIHWFSLVVYDYLHWCSLIFNDFH